MFTVRHSQSPSEAAKLHTWPVHAAFRHVGQRASGPVGQRKACPGEEEAPWCPDLTPHGLKEASDSAC